MTESATPHINVICNLRLSVLLWARGYCREYNFRSLRIVWMDPGSWSWNGWHQFPQEWSLAEKKRISNKIEESICAHAAQNGQHRSCHHFASSCFGSNFPSSWTMKKSILVRPLHISRQGIWVHMTRNFSLFLRDQGKRWPIIVSCPAVRCLKWDICDPHAHSPAWGVACGYNASSEVPCIPSMLLLYICIDRKCRVEYVSLEKSSLRENGERVHH
jgi:hypothetical protein